MSKKLEFVFSVQKKDKLNSTRTCFVGYPQISKEKKKVGVRVVLGGWV